jgi:cell division control protein 24
LDEAYHIYAPNNADYATLLDKIEKKVSMCARMPDNGWDGLRIKYMDEDGDLVTIRTNEDVATSFEGRDSSDLSSTLNLYVTQL